MATASASSTPTGVTLTDPRLFRQSCYIDGAWVNAKSGGTVSVDNPATGEVIGTVPRMGTAETRDAIEAADRAFQTWRKKTGKEKAAVLRRWFELMMANVDDLARLMTIEQGKPLAESKGEVAYAAAFLEWFGEEAKRIYGDTIPGHQGDKRIVVLKQPIGVAACITPWNFPLAMITRKAGPAIAAGCTVVLKPASQTPFSALALAELAERAGIPKGVFNVVTGSAAEIGKEMTTNPIVKKVSFTGSTEVGKVLMTQAAGTVKKL
jgi:succinate-semialdehyde dehydrogenase/glutarate-semialdehyde dehydrogenase